MKTLAVVPARAGSKGLPGKNKRLFHGKPLVSWAIEVGMRTCWRTVVTSDDPDVLRIAERYGVEAIERPWDLAQDDTPMLDVLRHVLAVQTKSSDAVVLLQPTQPLRTDAQIREAINGLVKGIDSVVSVVPIPAHMSPDYAVKLEAGLLSSFLPQPVNRRQDCRPAYYRDGTVYVIKTALLRQGKMYGCSAPLVLDVDEGVTIDTEADWVRAEQLWRTRHV
jgi:N-acylneuraminate cytidylyltransferase